MRVSVIAAAAALVILASLDARGQAPSDPPALCRASASSWNTARNAAGLSQWRALLDRTPDACVNLRAEIERRISGAKAVSEAHKAPAVPPRKIVNEATVHDENADALNKREAHVLAAQVAEDSSQDASSAQSSRRARSAGPGTVMQDCRNCPAMVAVPGGEVVMGSSESEEGRSRDEGPQTTIMIAPLWIGRFEITFDEWDACVRDGGCGGYSPPDSGWGRGTRPVIFVSWADAMSYAAWLSKQTGHHYRLLSESEWEYAARARSRNKYGFDGDASEICKYGNVPDLGSAYAGAIDCSDGFGRKTAPVGQFRPNAFGLYDMIGNVSELVADCYHDSLLGENSHGLPYQSADCEAHVLKGSAWGLWQPESAYNEVRIAVRFRAPDNYEHGGNGYGFRVAREFGNW